MKKNFLLSDPKKALDRHVEAIKHEINKYIARERRKELPEGVDFWDFNSKIGTTESNSKAVHVNDINKEIDKLVAEENTSFYLEILASAKKRVKNK